MSTATIEGSPNTKVPMTVAPEVMPMSPASACSAYIAWV
jgi:hypothetical protein